MRKPIRKLVRLRVDEISCVERGAGEGVKIVLLKRQDDELHKHEVSKMTSEEMFSEWWSQLSAEQRKMYRRLQSLIDEQNAIDERAARQQQWTTPPDMVHGNEQDPLSANERRGYGSGARAKALDLRAIAKLHGGVAAISKMICADNDAHRITEAELVHLAKMEAEGTGKSVGELLLADATLAKACQIARYGEMARQAERHVFDSNIRSRMAQASD